MLLFFIEGKVNEKDGNDQTFTRIFYHPYFFGLRNDMKQPVQHSRCTGYLFLSSTLSHRQVWGERNDVANCCLALVFHVWDAKIEPKNDPISVQFSCMPDE
jgi:hypothetical protein